MALPISYVYFCKENTSHGFTRRRKENENKCNSTLFIYKNHLTTTLKVYILLYTENFYNQRNNVLLQGERYEIKVQIRVLCMTL